MILRTAAASPFGRKVEIAAHMLGLADRIEAVETDTGNAADPVRRDNPLGKIPTLVLDDGTTLFDSRVIVEYLDHLARVPPGQARATVSGQGPADGLIPAASGPRFAALKLQALADGIADAALLKVYEGRWRDPAKHEPRWVDHQSGKIERGLGALEDAPPDGPVTVGHVALACALGYLDLRFGGEWRPAHPRLVAWLDAFARAVPAFEATRVKPA